MAMDYDKLVADISLWAKELGFQEVGITDTDLSDYEPDYRSWLARRFHGEMEYMERNAHLRMQPNLLLPDTIRVLSLRMDYLPVAVSDAQSDSSIGYISRYALGRDYHKVIRRRLARLARRIADAAGGAYRAFVDSAPVMEKPFAEKAGLGWIGKNTLLLNESAGSWFFLGEIYTDIPLPTTDRKAEDKCGKCTACISVCPTDAIVGPRQLDARRCISYLTIEHKTSIDPDLRPLIGNRIFGCDDCQLVCPWNRFARSSTESDFAPRHGLDAPSLVELLSWNESVFRSKTEGMALKRINYHQWVRNLAIAAGNTTRTEDLFLAVLRKRDECLQDQMDMCIEHLDWALSRLNAAAN